MGGERKKETKKKNVKYQGQAQRFNVAGGGVCVRGLLVCVCMCLHIGIIMWKKEKYDTTKEREREMTTHDKKKRKRKKENDCLISRDYAAS